MSKARRKHNIVEVHFFAMAFQLFENLKRQGSALFIDRDIQKNKEEFGVILYDETVKAFEQDAQLFLSTEDDPLVVAIRPALLEAQREVAALLKKRSKAETEMTEREQAVKEKSTDEATSTPNKAVWKANAIWNTAKGKTHLALIDQKIRSLKFQFGLKVYDTLVDLEKQCEWLPSDPVLKDAYKQCRANVERLEHVKKTGVSNHGKGNLEDQVASALVNISDENPKENAEKGTRHNDKKAPDHGEALEKLKKNGSIIDQVALALVTLSEELPTEDEDSTNEETNPKTEAEEDSRGAGSDQDDTDQVDPDEKQSMTTNESIIETKVDSSEDDLCTTHANQSDLSVGEKANVDCEPNSPADDVDDETEVKSESASSQVEDGNNADEMIDHEYSEGTNPPTSHQRLEKHQDTDNGKEEDSSTHVEDDKEDTQSAECEVADEEKEQRRKSPVSMTLDTKESNDAENEGNDSAPPSRNDDENDHDDSSEHQTEPDAHKDLPSTADVKEVVVHSNNEGIQEIDDCNQDQLNETTKVSNGMEEQHESVESMERDTYTNKDESTPVLHDSDNRADDMLENNDTNVEGANEMEQSEGPRSEIQQNGDSSDGENIDKAENAHEIMSKEDRSEEVNNEDKAEVTCSVSNFCLSDHSGEAASPQMQSESNSDAQNEKTVPVGDESGSIRNVDPPVSQGPTKAKPHEVELRRAEIIKKQYEWEKPEWAGEVPLVSAGSRRPTTPEPSHTGEQQPSSEIAEVELRKAEIIKNEYTWEKPDWAKRAPLRSSSSLDSTDKKPLPAEPEKPGEYAWQR